MGELLEDLQEQLADSTALAKAAESAGITMAQAKRFLGEMKLRDLVGVAGRVHQERAVARARKERFSR